MAVDSAVAADMTPEQRAESQAERWHSRTCLVRTISCSGMSMCSRTTCVIWFVAAYYPVILGLQISINHFDYDLSIMIMRFRPHKSACGTRNRRERGNPPSGAREPYLHS